ncbi:mycothiol transferase [Saccharopolyspora rosea]|uniref:DinB family protein n=1 Tax=Saccharopolyspora rosea TaxID=524884 RepID=A0ABW3FRF2_9PSEU|nr:DinB family protein [Saccharopolyspora rosea]
MTSADLLVDAFSRIREAVHEAAEGLDADQLAHRVDEGANSIAWLVWHLTRVQDDHVSDLAEVEQVWTAQGWADRFGLALPVDDTGYGHDADDVAAVRVGSADLLTDYHDAVFEQTVGYVGKLTDADLPRIIDDAWDPPVSLGVRLVSVIADDLQHAGQANFLRGVLERG